MNEPCPLCHSESAAECHRDKARPYFRCPVCALVFVPALFHLTPREERSRYDLHENDSQDKAYRAFLMKLGGPLMERLEPGARGLDYGSGPGPLPICCYNLYPQSADRIFPKAVHQSTLQI